MTRVENAHNAADIILTLAEIYETPEPLAQMLAMSLDDEDVASLETILTGVEFEGTRQAT